MCIFSGKINEVTNTCIFARMTSPNVQAIVYQMAMDAPQDVAMILPIPVIPGAKETDLRFINLKTYSHFFSSLDRGFSSGDPFATLGPDEDSLQVHQVGSYIASFAPNMDSLGKLDRRFQLPAGILEKAGPYADYGFAVFQYKPGKQKIHPMALVFATRFADRLYFPTVHIHDGEVHEKEKFDHKLYCQLQGFGGRAMLNWEESSSNAVVFAQAGLSQGILNPATHVYRLAMRGEFENKDQWAKAV
jgi:hypothetical protein